MAAFTNAGTTVKISKRNASILMVLLLITKESTSPNRSDYQGYDRRDLRDPLRADQEDHSWEGHSPD